ncbi:trafficking protein particle complex subunit 10-like, partial [Daktulosphaira vitifoliae]|uniref:trafficking protein particle complex subunit 10-like n=1 Tax=Daktulosphaira vitifoliae TaxID=58002 RepID=UPI0021A9EEE6
LYELGSLCGLLTGKVQTTEHLHNVQVLCSGMQSGHDLSAATESIATLKRALSSSDTFSKHYLLYELGSLCGLLTGKVQTTEHLHNVQVLCSGMQSGHDLSAATESIATLKRALSSSDTFSKHYLEVAELAISANKHNKLMTCAHSLVGLELAKFYTLSGDTTKRTMFLVRALNIFEQDNWDLLVVQTNLELVKCFKKIGNVDQFVKTCLQLCSSPNCNMQIRQDHFDQMLEMVNISNIGK